MGQRLYEQEMFFFSLFFFTGHRRSSLLIPGRRAPRTRLGGVRGRQDTAVDKWCRDE